VSGVDLNVGFHDQRLATEWVKENVESFGGTQRKLFKNANQY
jgi:carboxylesterase type B